ncbi:hypothetical protein EMCG_06524 [[Emmonsia] crescens]|uniref:Uncharacterized protein n=1 Tax=[Emmonsia] crescens TaxID=73230 RepID=A0A0G2J6P5_9EURO|nr:hypothetical protein EMCG_06524 [Emmonsia crescens UAMH 3008]
MSGPAFGPIRRPSSTDTLIDPREDHITMEEFLAALTLLELSGCSPQEMRAAEIQLSWYCDDVVGSWMATLPASTLYYPHNIKPRRPAVDMSLDFEDSSNSSQEDINPLLADDVFYATPPQSPRAVLAASIHLGMRTMTIHAPENTPPDSDSSATGMKYSAQDSSGNTETSNTSGPSDISFTLDTQPNDVKMTDFSAKVTISSYRSQDRASICESTGTLAAQSAPQPTRRSTRQRKDSRRMIEAKESEKLKTY